MNNSSKETTNDVCRICLSTTVDKDISDLRIEKNENKETYTEVLSFCLGIQVTKDMKHRKLCKKCFNKILSFYKFKTLALKNDASLKFLNPDCTVKLEVFVREPSESDAVSTTDDINIDTYYNEEKIQEDCGYDNEMKLDIKEEPTIKTEDDCLYQSDDEVLACLKSTNSEKTYEKEDAKEKPQVKKKRGRPSKKIVIGGKVRDMCPECGKAVYDLNLHIQQHLAPEDKKVYKCSDCDKTFSSYRGRKKHYRTLHLGQKKHCDICNKDVSYLKSHILLVHERESMQWSCMFCNKRFISSSALQNHIFIHTENRPHECDICHKKFRLKQLMSNHKLAVHENVKSYLCQFCPRSFFKKSHLDGHLRVHTKERPYQCPECNKFFSSSSVLKKHRVLHTGVRKYQCQHCDSSFAHAGNLTKHLLTHTREKKYKCKYCGTMFLRPDHRKRHEYTAHEKHLTVLNLAAT